MTTVTVLGTHEIPAVPAKVGGARRWLSGVLAWDHASVVDDVVLLACELVTNSILHSDSAGPGQNGGPGTVTLVVVSAGDVVRVEVIDAGSATNTLRVVVDGGDALSGRGLRWSRP